MDEEQLKEKASFIFRVKSDSKRPHSEQKIHFATKETFYDNYYIFSTKNGEVVYTLAPVENVIKYLREVTWEKIAGIPQIALDIEKDALTLKKIEDFSIESSFVFTLSPQLLEEKHGGQLKLFLASYNELTDQYEMMHINEDNSIGHIGIDSSAVQKQFAEGKWRYIDSKPELTIKRRNNNV